ncbi:hypothetical protein JW960_05770 [candidate division KSB1 bacterium]|nr:hypothetical protein [candidate division KSB1 bacterium]
MRIRPLHLFVISFMLVLGYQLANCWGNHPRDNRPGIVAPNDPIQETLKGEQVFQFKSFRIHRLASFEITARVLAKERYRFDREAKLAPYDLAMGWKRMSDLAVIESFSISQNNRFYWWSAKHMPIPRPEIISSSANMHIIPANDIVRDMLDNIHKYDVIHLKGYLVHCVDKDGWNWTSSLRRTDSGAGACELIWTESVEILKY